MRKSKNHGLLIFLLTFILTMYCQEKAYAQNIIYKTRNLTDRPANQDAVSSTPNNDKILLKYERDRVLIVPMALDETEFVHHHCSKSVFYLQETEGFLDAHRDGTLLLRTRKTS